VLNKYKKKICDKKLYLKKKMIKWKKNKSLKTEKTVIVSWTVFKKQNTQS